MAFDVLTLDVLVGADTEFGRGVFPFLMDEEQLLSTGVEGSRLPLCSRCLVCESGEAFTSRLVEGNQVPPSVADGNQLLSHSPGSTALTKGGRVLV